MFILLLNECRLRRGVSQFGSVQKASSTCVGRGLGRDGCRRHGAPGTRGGRRREIGEQIAMGLPARGLDPPVRAERALGAGLGRARREPSECAPRTTRADVSRCAHAHTEHVH